MRSPNDIKFNCTHDHQLYLSIYICNGDAESAIMYAAEQGWMIRGLDYQTAITMMNNVKERYND